MLTAGDTLLFETNYNADRREFQKHLHVIVIKPVNSTNLTILIPISTYDTPKQDSTTILNEGCHEFITRKSFVDYRRAILKSMDDLEQMVNEGVAIAKEPFTDQILIYIREGIIKSRRTPMEVMDYYKDSLFNNL